MMDGRQYNYRVVSYRIQKERILTTTLRTVRKFVRMISAVVETVAHHWRIDAALPVFTEEVHCNATKPRIFAFCNSYKRLKRFGYVDCVITIDGLIDRSDDELFKKVCAPNHSLYHLLPPYRSTDLRLRGHPFPLPVYCTDLHKKSFIVRTLHKYIKWYCIGIILLMLFYRFSYLVCFVYYRQVYAWCAFVAS